jgi:hypothetical protein
MTRGRKILVWLVCIVAAIYGTFLATFPTTTINYRLTLEAMTPDGPKTGSGVIQVSYGSDFNLNGGGRKGSIKVTGEAVYLDLGRDRNLFVTLSEQSLGRSGDRDEPLAGETAPQWLPVQIFGFKWDWGDERKLAQQLRAARAKGPKDVPLIALPTTVTFRDLADPKSVELVDPRDIGANFGQGYVMTRAQIELVNDGVKWNIREVLPWLPEYYDKHFDGSRFTTINAKNRTANYFSAGAFDTRGN